MRPFEGKVQKQNHENIDLKGTILHQYKYGRLHEVSNTSFWIMKKFNTRKK